MRGWLEAGDVNEILLHHSQTSEVFATQIIRFGLLLLLLDSSLRLPLLLRLPRLMRRHLLGRDGLVLDILVVVLSPTRGAEAIHVVLDAVVAELADLCNAVRFVSLHVGCVERTHLISAGTRTEAFVRKIELLHA